MSKKPASKVDYSISPRKKQFLPVNPFSDDYWKAEVKAYGLSETPFQMEHVKVDWIKLQGRCDDYLNINMRFDDTLIPRLSINGDTWMSLTPMEIQSHALALHRARGHVLCGGLGLGYFAIRAAAKPEVSRVTVFENEPLVCEWFRNAFKDRPELAKITVVEGDMRKHCKDYDADIAYVDIYQSTLCPETFSDAKLFQQENRIGRYMFWGYERLILGLLLNRMLRDGSLTFSSDLNNYFHHWKITPMSDKTDGACLPAFCRLHEIGDKKLLLAGKSVLPPSRY